MKLSSVWSSATIRGTADVLTIGAVPGPDAVGDWNSDFAGAMGGVVPVRGVLVVATAESGVLGDACRLISRGAVDAEAGVEDFFFLLPFFFLPVGPSG